MTRGSPITSRWATNNSAPSTKKCTIGSANNRAAPRFGALGEGLTIVSAADTDAPLYSSLWAPRQRRARRLSRVTDELELRPERDRTGVERDLVIPVVVPGQRLAALGERAAGDRHPQVLAGREFARLGPGPRLVAPRSRGGRGTERFLSKPVGADVDDRPDPHVAERLGVLDAGDVVGDTHRLVGAVVAAREPVNEDDPPAAGALGAVDLRVERAGGGAGRRDVAGEREPVRVVVGLDDGVRDAAVDHEQTVGQLRVDRGAVGSGHRVRRDAELLHDERRVLVDV